MSAISQSPTNRPIAYPESDGLLMADNTKQFRWIVTLQRNLDVLFATNPDVFVAGDLLVIDGMDGWISPLLSIRFDLSDEELQIFFPDGQRFLTFLELNQRAEAERQCAELAEQRAAALAARLRALGIDPDAEHEAQ